MKYSFYIFGKENGDSGGVRSSILNIKKSINSNEWSVSIGHGIKEIFKKNRYDYSFVNYSRPWKRFLGSLVGRLISKKVIIIIHGNCLSRSKFNSAAVFFSSCVGCLNENVFNIVKARFPQKIVVLQSPFFLEGVSESSDKEKVNLPAGRKILVYGSSYGLDGIADVYGVEYICSNLAKIIKLVGEEFCLVVLDPNGVYRNSVTVSDANIFYIDKNVDFVFLVGQCDLYLRPTKTDGRSVAVDEAMMVGTKVLASDEVARQEGVLLFSLYSIEDLSDKISQVFSDAKALPKERLLYSPPSFREYIENLPC